MFTRSDFDAFVRSLPFPPNDFQLKVHESIAFGEGNIVVSALAGSGKTSLLVQTAKLFAAMNITSVNYLAFNVSIKNELNKRLPKPYSAINSHSLGMQVLKGVNPKTRVNTAKWAGIAKGYMSKIGVEPMLQYAAGKVFQSLCSKVMLNMVDPTDLYRIGEIAVQYGLDTVTTAMMKAVDGAIKEAREIWERTGEISFDEMLYWPVVLNLQPPQHNFFLVDECLPYLTPVQLADGTSLPIGDIVEKKLDVKVLAYDTVTGEQRACKITHWSKTPNQKPLVKIKVRSKQRIGTNYHCYRCPTSHLDLARKLVPAIEARPGADAGVIEYVDETKVPDMAKAGSLVMCRLTAPLVSMYFKFIQRKISAKVMGKDIGAQLIGIMDKVAKYEGYRYERSIEFLEKYREHQVMNLRQKDGTEQQIENVNDQVETLIVCITNFDSAKTLDMLKAVLEDLFGDQDKEAWEKMVTLCTVHRAKGLEADETFLLKPEKMPLIWKDQRPDEYEQELNILYVALTRSKKRMVVAGELSSVVKPLNQVVSKALAQDEAETISPEDENRFSPLPLQPALLPIETPVALPPPAPIKDFSAALERFNKPVTITPVQVKPAERQRAAYSRAVLASLEQLSTGEIMQFMNVLQAILDERKEAV